MKNLSKAKDMLKFIREKNTSTSFTLIYEKKAQKWIYVVHDLDLYISKKWKVLSAVYRKRYAEIADNCVFVFTSLEGVDKYRKEKEKYVVL